MSKNIRAAARASVALLAVIPCFFLILAQGLIVGPLLEKKRHIPSVRKIHGLIPNFAYNAMKHLLGIRISFNKASKPVVGDKPVWYVANHMSIADFIVIGATFDGTFAGKGDILKWPVVALAARAVKYVGLRRTSEYNHESRAKIANNFNEGYNTIVFPEATTTPGDKLYLFRAALFELLYGGESIDKTGRAVALEKDVVVQPVAIRVAAVDGVDARGRDDLRELYSMYREDDTLRRIWKRLQVRSIDIELTAFDPLKPSDYADAKELINAAALSIATVASPGQTVFEKAEIPDQAAKPAASAGA